MKTSMTYFFVMENSICCIHADRVESFGKEQLEHECNYTANKVPLPPASAAKTCKG
jgi:hypothetical protein